MNPSTVGRVLFRNKKRPFHSVPTHFWLQNHPGSRSRSFSEPKNTLPTVEGYFFAPKMNPSTLSQLILAPKKSSALYPNPFWERKCVGILWKGPFWFRKLPLPTVEGCFFVPKKRPSTLSQPILGTKMSWDFVEGFILGTKICPSTRPGRF